MLWAGFAWPSSALQNGFQAWLLRRFVNRVLVIAQGMDTSQVFLPNLSILDQTRLMIRLMIPFNDPPFNDPAKKDQMTPRLTKLLEMLVGKWEPAIATALGKFGLGIVIPTAILVYAISCALSRESKVITRGGLAEITGLPAVAIAVAYATIGVIIYVHVCWDDHPYFAGLRHLALQFLLLIIIIALAATFGLALI